MTLFKKDEGEPSYKSAVERYRQAAGQLFTAPSKKRSTFEKGAWLLCDYSGELICIVNPQTCIFGRNLMGYMLQSAG